MALKIKRAYEKPEKEDGIRVLVDRIWPRGISKEDLKIDHWLKEAAPTAELRKWFGHDPEKFSEFKQKYEKELDSENGQLKELVQLAKTEDQPITLVYGAKDEEHNQAVVLKEAVEKRL